jgi:hypothetical protein
MPYGKRLPITLPARYTLLPGVTLDPDIDTGGYDFSIGGMGFRYASDAQNPYQRTTEATTIHRFDSSLEPGEQSLAEIPWIKSQASFHGGAGQLNLERGFTAFQYLQEQVQHVRFDNSYGVDVWTPGKVKRLPDCHAYTVGAQTLKTVVTSAIGGFDYAIVGGQGTFYQLKWSSGPDNAPTPTQIDLSGAIFGGVSNCNIVSLASDGTNYFALITLTVAGSTANVKTLIVTGLVTSVAAPTSLYDGPATNVQLVGEIHWEKARLIGAIGQSIYELSSVASAHSAFPTPNYTHPEPNWTWSDITASPSSILVSGYNSGPSSSYMIELVLTATGGTPTLVGGAAVGEMPEGEYITSLASSMGSFIVIGTNRGIRIGTFDTYTGALRYGPRSIEITQASQTIPFLAVKDRFVYGALTNQQDDGSTGLVCIDLSYQVDDAGRMAWTNGLHPPTSATQTGVTSTVAVLPLSQRVIYTVGTGLFVEGNGPGTDGNAYLRTSRIRYDTSEPKLFKYGKIQGEFISASTQITAIYPNGITNNLGTFGFFNSSNPGSFGFPADLAEWIQLQFSLIGATCVLNSYQARAIPAPTRQHIITVSGICRHEERDRAGMSMYDALTPRQRYNAMLAIESAGAEIRFVEYTPEGNFAQLVVIEQMDFHTTETPSYLRDIDGYITFKLRATS